MAKQTQTVRAQRVVVGDKVMTMFGETFVEVSAVHTDATFRPGLPGSLGSPCTTIEYVGLSAKCTSYLHPRGRVIIARRPVAS